MTEVHPDCIWQPIPCDCGVGETLDLEHFEECSMRPHRKDCIWCDHLHFKDITNARLLRLENP